MVFKVKIISHKDHERNDHEIVMVLTDSSNVATEETTVAVNSDQMFNEGELEDPEGFGEVVMIQLSIKEFLDRPQRVDVIEVERVPGKEMESESYVFPIQRLLKCDNKYMFHVYDVILPQYDTYLDQRHQEIAEERIKYELAQSYPNGPLMVKNLPDEEEEIYMTLKRWVLGNITKLLLYVGLTDMFTFKVKKIEDYKNLMKFFPEPNCTKSCGSDIWFGKQRLQGINPLLITLCHTIPENFAVEPIEVEPFLQGKSLEEAMENDQIFLANLELLHDLQNCTSTLWAPMGLFYKSDNGNLLPIAIQLSQEPGPENPVFLPSDPEFTWKCALSYYNVAEGVHHEAVSHLSNVHIVLDVVCVSMRRIMSKSHPIYRLLNPHFWRLLGNNHYGLIALFKDGGIFEKSISGGNSAARALLSKYFSKPISFKVFHPRMDFEGRGVLSSKILPNYPYRDDGLLVFDAIINYVRKIVDHYYDRVSKLKTDSELRDWRLQLGRSQEFNGCGFTDIPGNEEEGFQNNEDLIQTCAAIIYTASAKHSAVNYPQYECYSYPPNHPLKLNAPPLTSKKAITEKEFVDLLPDNITTLRTMLFATLLSHLDGGPLGDFEVQHLYHPTDLKAVEELKEDLAKCTETINERNKDRDVPYPYMTTSYIKNSPNV